MDSSTAFVPHSAQNDKGGAPSLCSPYLKEEQIMKPYPEYKSTALDWLPRVPAHWEVKKGKRIFYRAMREVRPEDEVVTAFRDGQVTLRKNRRTSGFTESLKEIGYQGIRKGDLVIHAMDAFAGAIGVSDSDGKSTPVYAACVPLDDANSYYFARLLQFVSHTGYLQALAKGIRERSTDFRYDNFANLQFPVPPLDEQAQIVRYLGAKHREIESYIAAKRTLLARLKELSAATISRAVTRGLNPDVALQSSGVEWLGDVPKHWQVKRLKFVTQFSYGDSLPDSSRNDSGSIHVYGSNGIVGFHDRAITKAPCIIVGRKGSFGKLNWSDVPCFPIDTTFFVDSANADLKFLFYALQCVGLDEISNDTAVPGLSRAVALEKPIPLPPLDEQRAIVDYLERQLAVIGEARERIEREIILAGELYQTLVANVVTGAIDVSGVQVVDELSEVDDELSQFVDDEPQFDDELSEVVDEIL